ncbi:MAG: 30S ribosomal protein S6 [Patescibacteria group bacterium]
METKILEEDLEGVSTLVDDASDVRTNVYEIGYHLLPTLSEEEVTVAVQGIMDTLKAENVTFVGDRFPSKIALAYTIAKRVNGKLTNFDGAYFGWVAFEAPRDAIARLKTALDANVSVLRSLIVVTERDAVAAALSGAVVGPTGSIDKPKREVEVGGEMSEVALDEALKTIATEDAKVSE